MKAIFQEKYHEGSDIYTFTFKPEKSFTFIAGQFIELTLLHQHPDDRGERRWFTLSSSPTENLLAITTRIVDKPSTFKKVLASLVPGEEVIISEPMGDFVLPLTLDTPLTFVAGGIGCTPFHSMSQWLIGQNQQWPVRIVLAARTDADFIWLETFRRIDPQTLLVTDRLTIETVLDHSSPDSQIYLSGPESLIEDLTKGLLAAGVPAYRILSDYFPGYSKSLQ